VTGPTGSGKTTTLYSALSELNEPDDKIITTEDPIEYDIEGIVQVPIDSDIGVTFASALRAILRQDPDRILVGEIRDVETAEIAIQAALTGHMVFSTLHTNDSPATVTRLRDMGVQPFLITATVEAILAQRLVRRICKDCKEEYIPDAESLADLELTSDQIVGKTFYRGSGCDKCSGSGYKGRLGLYELLIMTDELRDLVVRNASTEEIRDLARKAGMVTLRDSGMVNMFEGHTTADEVIRETILEA
jgi:type IV pilus assembly protein PilB